MWIITLKSWMQNDMEINIKASLVHQVNLEQEGGHV